MKTNTTKYIKSLKLTILASILVSMFMGCSKMVDVDLPHNSITEQGAYISNDQATSVIAGLYSQLMTNSGSPVFSNGSVTLYAGLSADELESYQGVANAVDFPFYSNKVLFDNSITSGTIWTPAYSVIFGCNAAIAGITNSPSAALDASSRKLLIGEAKFIRAFSYFYLVNLFGEIPMPLVTDFNQTAGISKSSVADVYAQVITDLKDAQANLPADFAVSVSNERVRVNKWAATALLARVYLFNKDWANAEIQASSVISSPLFALGTLDNLFLKNSTETIFALKQNTTKIPFGGTYDANNFVPTVLFSSFSAANAAPLLASAETYSAASALFFPSYNMTAKLASSFETGDLRRTKWTLSWISPTLPPYNSRMFYTANKYKVKAGSATAANNEYYIVLRLAEQYLIRAEARANQSNLSGAAADLLPLRSRAGLTGIPITSQAQVLDAIAHERQIELFAEWGHRWLDLKRTGKAEAVLGIIPDKQPWNNNQLLYPIPPADIISNPKLNQNPGYE